MKPSDTFDILLLIARPAAGKSEIIDYLKRVPVDQRIQRFHIGPFEELDDFPMLWTWFEEDDLLEKMGYPRLYTDADGMFLHQYLWDLLIERIGLEYHKRQRDASNTDRRLTTIVEFSRGSEHGGYASAFAHLPADMLPGMAVLYVDVPWEESLRKNRKRFNPDRPDSILEHGLSDEKMERLYRDSDWQQVSRGKPAGKIRIAGQQTPFVVFPNADDVTTPGGTALGERLEECLGRLWGLYLK